MLCTKALAIREAIVDVIQKQIEQIIIESDSLLTVNAINGKIIEAY